MGPADEVHEALHPIAGLTVMAGINEVALGIATVLPSDFTPDPLHVDLWGEPPDAGAAPVKATMF